MGKTGSIPTSNDGLLPRTEAIEAGHMFYSMDQCRICGSLVGRISRTRHSLTSRCAWHHKHGRRLWTLNKDTLTEDEDSRKVNKTLLYWIEDGKLIGPFRSESLLSRFQKRYLTLISKELSTYDLFRSSGVKDQWEGINTVAKEETFDAQRK